MRSGLSSNTILRLAFEILSARLLKSPAKQLLLLFRVSKNPLRLLHKTLKSTLVLFGSGLAKLKPQDQIGVTTGLAWTEVGGELLNIEAVMVPGKGKVSATGKLGEVMKESIQAAEFFIRARAQSYGIDLADLAKHDVHVHVPEGQLKRWPLCRCSHGDIHYFCSDGHCSASRCCDDW